MTAIVYTEYGRPDGLQLKEVEKPYPKANEVLIKIRAVSVNYGDTLARNFKNVSPGAFNMPLLFWVITRKVKASLTQNGIYLSVSFKMKKLLQMLWTSVTGAKGLYAPWPYLNLKI